MKKVVIVGKRYERDRANGSTAVIFALEQAFEALRVPYEDVTLNEANGKFAYLLKLLRLVGCRDCVINAHIDGFLSAFIVLMISRLNRSCRYYLTVHGIYREQIKYSPSERNTGLYCRLERIVYEGFPNLICVSELCKKKLLEHYRPRGRIYVVENAVNTAGERYQPKAEINKRFLFLGGTKPVKGIDRLLGIFGCLIRMDPEVRLKILGGTNPTEQAAFSRRIRDIPEGSIEFCGMVRDRDKLISAYQESAFHVALSKFDTFNTTIIEAMRCGCLNISNLNSGAAYLIREDSGYIVDESLSDREIAAGLCAFINGLSLERYNEMTKNACDTAAGYTWINSARRYLSVFGGE